MALAHPDDEIGAAGTMLAHRDRGHRVVLVWLTRGEMTEAFGPVSPEEVMQRRMAHGERAGAVLGVETRFLDFPDTRLQFTPQASEKFAALVADVRPDAVLTWGSAWKKGMRHPDHQACGEIVRAALTLARIRKVVAPADPHRAAAPVFTYRGIHTPLPSVAIDVEPYLEGIMELGAVYREDLQFPDPDWLRLRLTEAARPFGVRYAEVFDAWESEPGLVDTLFDSAPYGFPSHPERLEGTREGSL